MTVIERLGILAVAGAVGAGCINTHTVSRPLSPESIHAINQAGRVDPPLAVVLGAGVQPLDPPRLEVKSVADGDQKQMTFIGLSGEERLIDSARVRSVRVTNRGRGAVQGLAGGAIGGALVGVLIGASEDPFIFSRGELMTIGGIAFGLIGALTGLLAGAAVGEQTVYVFEDRP